jgi:diguanylate cyclase (GGDEF)-like protein
MVVLLPSVALAILTASDARANWTSRHRATVVASEATELQIVARARGEVFNVITPLAAVSYALAHGIDEETLSRLLGTDFSRSIRYGVATINNDPDFRSTPILRADEAQLLALVPKVQADTISYTHLKTQTDKVLADLVNLWEADDTTLQTTVANWNVPGAFELRVAALRQTFQADVQAGLVVQSEVNVMTGGGGAAAKRQLIESNAAYTFAAEQFAGHLGPQGRVAWKALQASTAARTNSATLETSIRVALGEQAAPWATDPTLAGPGMTAGLDFLGDVNALVQADSADLHDSALAQVTKSTGDLVREIVYLFLLVGISLGGVIVAGRSLSRPLQKLAEAAQKVGDGEFDLAPLSDRGPREVVATNVAFNDMASTLKALEAKAVALAAEDLGHPELQVPLPGRTGRALQATVDHLTTRIGERERQRHDLHELATHDRLTGLLNRAAIFDYLTHDVAHRREDGETVAVLFIDLDGLKVLNDTHGHDAGDRAIVATADALCQTIGEFGMVGRLGGDEFLVVLSGEERRRVISVAERIRLAVAACRVTADGMDIPLQCSIGVAFAETGSDIDPMELVRQADVAMYDAKRAAHASAELGELSTWDPSLL